MPFNSPHTHIHAPFSAASMPQVEWEGVSPDAICAARMPWYFHPPPTTSHLHPYIFFAEKSTQAAQNCLISSLPTPLPQHINSHFSVESVCQTFCYLAFSVKNKSGLANINHTAVLFIQQQLLPASVIITWGKELEHWLAFQSVSFMLQSLMFQPTVGAGFLTWLLSNVTLYDKLCYKMRNPS